MKIGYLPLITNGGGVFRKVFDWKSTVPIINNTLKLFKELGTKISYIGNPINISKGWLKSEKLFLEEKIDVLFVHNLNIVGGEPLYNLTKTLEVPVIIASIPEPANLYEPPYTARYASFCGGQWNINMCYLGNIKAKFLFGNPEEEKFKYNLKKTLKAIDTINKLKEWKVCLIGDKTPGYYGAIYSEDLLMREFGAKVVFLDFGMLSLLEKDINESKVSDFAKSYYRKEDIDKMLSTEHINNTVRAYLALDKYAKENGISSYTMKCVPETIFILGACPCGINSILIEKGYISGCEGDILTTLTMQISYLLSSKKPLQVDIMSIREPNDSMLLWHCGAGAPSIAGSNKVTYTNSPILCDGKGKAQGVCVNFIPQYGKMNVCQLSEDWKTQNYRFFTADGETRETKPFIGGNPIRIKFNILGEELGHYIIDNHLPHHFQIVGESISSYIEEFCFWKDIDLLRV